MGVLLGAAVGSADGGGVEKVGKDPSDPLTKLNENENAVNSTSDFSNVGNSLSLGFNRGKAPNMLHIFFAHSCLGTVSCALKLEIFVTALTLGNSSTTRVTAGYI